MKKKSMLVNVNEEKFEQCRTLIEKTWGLKLSNSDVVDYIDINKHRFLFHLYS